MYYYIFEPVRQPSQRKVQDKIKRLVLNLGISGETVTSSPARSINDLVDIAIAKGFTTVVCVGSDLFVNKVMSALLLKVDLSDSKVAFGIVPLDYQKSFFARRLKFASVEEACQNLRFRYLNGWDVGFINPAKFFLTPLVAAVNHQITLKIILPEYELISSFTDLQIDTGISVSWTDSTLGPNILARLSSYLFNRELVLNNRSTINCKSAKIITDPSIPIYLDGEIIAKTPVHVKVFPSYLQVIVNRDTILNSERRD